MYIDTLNYKKQLESKIFGEETKKFNNVKIKLFEYYMLTVNQKLNK